MPSNIIKTGIHLAIQACLLIFLPVACKKDVPALSDDPHIIHTPLNITIPRDPVPDPPSYNWGTAGIDINNDSINDFNAWFFAHESEYRTYLERLNSNQLHIYYLEGNAFLLNDPPGSSIMDLGYMEWGNLGHCSFINTDVTWGFTGAGEIISGIRLSINSAFHYGWIKFNIPADHKSFTIIEAAYDTRPNTPIRAGAK